MWIAATDCNDELYMNIWLIQIGEPLPLDSGVRKMRTGLLADKLAERGHDVRWWASAFEHQRKIMVFDRDIEYPLRDGLALQILKGCGYRRNISLRRYLDHRIVAGKFGAHAVALPAPDVIVASMPDHHLAWEAVQYARKRGIPILVDVRDPWPDIFVDALPSGFFRALARGVLAGDFHKRAELLRGANGILAMSEGLLRWALGKVPRPACPWDRVFYMGYKNAPLEPSTPSPSWLPDKEDIKTFVYVGTFGHSYDLGLIIEAAKVLLREGRQDVRFILAGTGEQETELRHRAAALPNVLLPGWISAGEIRALLRAAWAGVVPGPMVSGAFPNKVFEYLSAGLPVVSSLEGEMADIITERGLGLNYRAGDLAGFIGAVRTLLVDEPLRNVMAEKAATFFLQRGDADVIYDDYARHVEALAASSIRVKGAQHGKMDKETL